MRRPFSHSHHHLRVHVLRLTPHLASTRCVLYVVFRSTARLDVGQVQLLIQDLDLQSERGGES